MDGKQTNNKNITDIQTNNEQLHPYRPILTSSSRDSNVTDKMETSEAKLKNLHTPLHNAASRSDETEGRLQRSSTTRSHSRSPVRGHLRTLSIASPSSSSSVSNSGSKKGINLGLNVIGNSAQLHKTNTNSSIAFQTPRRQLFVSPQNTDNHNVNRTSRNSNVTPLSNVVDDDTVDMSIIVNPASPVTPIQKINNVPPLSLPSSVTSPISEDGLSDNFRLLASKEMDILEIKNKIKDMVDKKIQMEFELQQLKLNIEKQLVSNLRKQNDGKSKVGSFDAHVPKSPTSIQKKPIRALGSAIDPLLDDSFTPTGSPEYNNNTNSLEYDKAHRDLTNSGKRQSWFSKPLNFIQQFDNLIYQEFEKLQIPEDGYTEIGKVNSNNYNDNIEYGNSNKPDINVNRKDSANINDPIKSLAEDSGLDVMQSVSQHLWSFVNEVKSNLIIEEPSSPSSQKHESMQNSKPQDRLRIRTPSISKRKSYGQYTTLKKKPSSSTKKSVPEKHCGHDAIKDSNNNKDLIDLSVVDDDDSGSVFEMETCKDKNHTNLLQDTEEIQESDLWDSELLDI